MQQQGRHQNMTYVNLGDSGLKVSRLGYGNFVNSNTEEEAQALANKLVKIAWDSGINFFDTAEAYSQGKGEIQLGNALRSLGVPREDYVVTTKIFWGQFPTNSNSHNNLGTSRKRLIEGTKRSLKNLQMEYVDVLFCHNLDIFAPIKEIIFAMKDIISSGKALYWGTSSWPQERVMEAMLLCDQLNCPRPIVEQCQYNMFMRKHIEKNYIHLFDDYKLGTTIWSPLCSGILTGKYNTGIPKGSRFDLNPRYLMLYNMYMGEGKREATVAKLVALGELAERLGCTQPQLCLAWTLISKDVTLCLMGASKPEQLESNLGALDVVEKLTPEVLAEIEGILKNRPMIGLDPRGWVPYPPRR